MFKVKIGLHNKIEPADDGEVPSFFSDAHAQALKVFKDNIIESRKTLAVTASWRLLIRDIFFTVSMFVTAWTFIGLHIATEESIYLFLFMPFILIAMSMVMFYFTGRFSYLSRRSLLKTIKENKKVCNEALSYGLKVEYEIEEWDEQFKNITNELHVLGRNPELFVHLSESLIKLLQRNERFTIEFEEGAVDNLRV